MTPLTPGPLFSPALSNNRLSVGSIRSKTTGQQMEKTAPVFDDPKMRYYQAYSELLDDLAKKDPSADQFGPHIEDWLVKSEQDWFSGYHYASLGMSSANSSTVSLLHSMKSEKAKTPRASVYVSRVRDSGDAADFRGILGNEYEVPSGLKKLLLLKAGTWHYYTILLALVSSVLSDFDLRLTRSQQGQILCANPYQLTLLTGQIGAPAIELYVLCTIYLVTSVCWWILHRYIRPVYLLSLPFFFFGLAFMILAVSSASKDMRVTGHLYNIASGSYTIGSSAYALFFALNFGTEGMFATRTSMTSPTNCIIQLA